MSAAYTRNTKEVLIEQSKAQKQAKSAKGWSINMQKRRSLAHINMYFKANKHTCIHTHLFHLVRVVIRTMCYIHTYIVHTYIHTHTFSIWSLVRMVMRAMCCSREHIISAHWSLSFSRRMDMAYGTRVQDRRMVMAYGTRVQENG